MTDSSNRVFPLDRLYAGANGQTRFDQVSRTPGVDPDQLAECRRLAHLMPPLPVQRTEAMPGAFGLFRGESIDYILAKAQQSANGAPQIQYILVPTAPLRSLGGNIRTFEGFACEPIPQFAVPRTDLAPFVLENPQAADDETQIDDLLALLGYCKNNMKIVSGLTAALVQSVGIGVINAPLSMRDRLTFIQGLLTLLPAAVRTRITFATSVIDPSQTNTQIKFLAADMRPARHLIYDWESGKLLTDAPADTYADFMITQFRLDPALVLKQTQQMEPIAIWRMRLKDDLPSALAWAAKRISLDAALKNGLPGDPQMVSVVLRDDPTLVDDMRVLYARHLLSLTLVLDEVERGDALVAALVKIRVWPTRLWNNSARLLRAKNGQRRYIAWLRAGWRKPPIWTHPVGDLCWRLRRSPVPTQLLQRTIPKRCAYSWNRSWMWHPPCNLSWQWRR